jgi:hypothetical protein
MTGAARIAPLAGHGPASRVEWRRAAPCGERAILTYPFFTRGSENTATCCAVRYVNENR